MFRRLLIMYDHSLFIFMFHFLILHILFRRKKHIFLSYSCLLILCYFSFFSLTILRTQNYFYPQSLLVKYLYEQVEKLNPRNNSKTLLLMSNLPCTIARKNTQKGIAWSKSNTVIGRDKLRTEISYAK